MTEFFLLHTDPKAAEIIKSAIALDKSFTLAGHAVSSKEMLFHLSSSPVKVVLVQLAVADVNGFELIQQIREKYPHVYVVPVLEGTEGGETWQQILQLQLHDVINGVRDPNAVLATLKSAAQRAQQAQIEAASSSSTQSQSSYLISVASARGGTGKSVFSTNLVIGMAKAKASACLVDYSMYAGDFFTMLDFVPRNTLADAISQGGQIDLQFLSTLIADHPLGFKFLACPNREFDFYSFDYEQARNLLNVSRSASEYIIVDTGAYDFPCTLAAIDESDLTFIVTTRDLARLLATQRYIKFLKDRELPPEKLKVIINNAEVGTEISESEIEDVLEHEVTAYLPSNPLQATFSINSGKPLSQTQSESPLCKVISRLSELCLQHWQIN